VPVPPASPRFIGGVCFVAAALVIGAGGTVLPAVPAGASQRQEGAPTTAADRQVDHDDSVDLLRADAEQVRVALAATVDRRARAEAALATARADATTAAAAVTTAEAAEKKAARRVAQLDADVKDAAVAAFVGSGRDIPLGVLVGDDVRDAAWEATVLQYQAEEFDALLDEQQAAHRRLDGERRQRAAAASEAAAAEQRATAEVDALIRLEDDQAELAAVVEQRLDSALAESAALAAIDAQAASALAAQEQDLANTAATSMSVPTTAPAPAPSATTTTAPKATPTVPPAGPGPVTPVTVAPTTTTPAPPVSVPAPIAVDSVNVGGFIVARSIADQLGRLLAAAQAAGLTLGGSALRDVNVQITLRRQHCGPTDYDIWLRPASQCSPPTAIPGRSMHEKGLAIDFTCAGVLINSRTSPCFVWLAANAAGYGLYNLPSEPWHWSTNGN